MPILDYIIKRFPFSRKVQATVYDCITHETITTLEGTDYDALVEQCEQVCSEGA